MLSVSIRATAPSVLPSRVVSLESTTVVERSMSRLFLRSLRCAKLAGKKSRFARFRSTHTHTIARRKRRDMAHGFVLRSCLHSHTDTNTYTLSHTHTQTHTHASQQQFYIMCGCDTQSRKRFAIRCTHICM